MGRVETLGDLLSWVQKDKNDDRQHERYSLSIWYKGIKTIAEASKMDVETERIKFDNQMIQDDERQLGYLKRKREETKMRHELNYYYKELPRRPITDINYDNVDDSFAKRQAYLQERIC